MKSFLIVWLVAFGLIAVIATGVGWYVGQTPQPALAERSQRLFEASEADAGPFTEMDAVEVVSRRLPATDSGNRLRRALQDSAKVTYHSPRHWRVCYDSACWIAHGPGRYAEPDNDEARQRESRPIAP